MARRPTGTVTFLFTDIEGSTKHWENHRSEMVVAHRRQEEIICQAVTAHGGYAYKMIGDAFQAAFDTACDALGAAVDAQRGLYAEAWTLPSPLRVRMALHTGVTEERENDYVGPALNRVARLLGAGYGGQILVTQATEELLRESLPDGVTLRDLGEHRLRDLRNSEHVYQVAIQGVPSEFPLLKTLDERPNNLPQRPYPLVGREKELAECIAMLERDDVRLLTLTGPGGIGKTRLALHTAAALLDSFADGVFVVDLAPINDPNQVPSAVLQALNVTEAAGASALETLTDYVRRKHLLLLLDNFEHVLPAVTVVGAALAAAPDLKVLATSRAPLHLSAEQEYPVPPLALPPDVEGGTLAQLAESDAVKLFVARAQAVQPSFLLTDGNARAVAETCRQLDGIPLAIEMAAARIRILSPQAMVTRMGSKLKLLAEGARDLPPRQRTMRAAIAWSYDLLTDAEKVLFRRLAVFPGDSTLDMIEAACNARHDSSGDVVDIMASLVEKNMLHDHPSAGGETRFHMMGTVQEFALERLVESGEEAEIRLEHAKLFTRLAEEAETHWRSHEECSWLDKLEAERTNLNAALRWAVDARQLDLGLRLAGSAWWFWYLRGHLSEGRHWLDFLIAQPNLEHDIPLCKCTSGAGYFAYLQGEYERAARLHDQSLACARSLGFQRGVAMALNDLGLVARARGDRVAARRLLQQSLEVGQSGGDRGWQAISSFNLGKVVYEIGDFGAARVLQEQALTTFTSLGDEWGTAVCMANLGQMVFDQGDDKEACLLFEKARAIQERLGDRRGMAITLVALARSAWNQADDERSRGYYEEALSVFRELGDRREIAAALEGLGNIALHQADYTTARARYLESLSIREEVGYRRGMASAYTNLGTLELRDGNLELAEATLHKAVAAWRELGEKPGIARALNSLGRVQTLRGDLDGGQVSLLESLSLNRESNSRHGIKASYSGLGQVAMQRGDGLGARLYFAQSLSMAGEMESKWDVARAMLGMAWVASVENDERKEVMLLAAADRLRQAINAQWEKRVSDLVAQAIEQTRAKLGEDVFASLWREGGALSEEAAIALAVDGGPIPEAPFPAAGQA